MNRQMNLADELMSFQLWFREASLCIGLDEFKVWLKSDGVWPKYRPMNSFDEHG